MVYLLLQVKLGSFFLGCFRDLSEIPTLDILVHVNRQQLEISDFHEHSLLVILTPGIRNTVTTRGLIFFFSGTCLSTAAIHSLGQRFEELFFDVFPIPGTEKKSKLVFVSRVMALMDTKYGETLCDAYTKEQGQTAENSV